MVLLLLEGRRSRILAAGRKEQLEGAVRSLLLLRLLLLMRGCTGRWTVRRRRGTTGLASLISYVRKEKASRMNFSSRSLWGLACEFSVGTVCLTRWQRGLV